MENLSTPTTFVPAASVTITPAAGNAGLAATFALPGVDADNVAMTWPILHRRRRLFGRVPARTFIVPFASIQAAASVGPMIRKLRDDGCSLRQIASDLAAQGIKTSRDGDAWMAAAVNAVLARLPV